MRAVVIDDSRAMRLIFARITGALGFDVAGAANGRVAREPLGAAA